MPSRSPVGTTRTFGARSIVSIRTVSGLVSPWPIVLGGIIVSASGSRAQAFQIFRFRQFQAGPTLRQTSTLAEVSEPLAHSEVEIEPCRTANSPTWETSQEGFSTTGAAVLWLYFSPRAGATPSLFLLRWPFQMHGCSASDRMIWVRLLQGPQVGVG